MKIGFDALIYAFPPGGIATYQTELMAALARRSDASPVFAGGWTMGEAGEGLTPAPIRQRHVVFGRNMLAALGPASEVRHVTAFWRPPLLRARALTLTVHDMIPERFGARFPAIRGAHHHKARIARTAAAIVCPSEAARRDAIELLGLPEERVFTAPHGAPRIVRPHDGPEGRHVMIVGRRSHYKNFLGVAAHLGRALAAHPGAELLCVGGGPFTPEEAATLSSAGLSGRARQASLGAADLARAYGGALAVVAPSLAEGFGLTVLEAMAHGAPVVASDIAAHREVAGEAALWFDPERPEGLTAALDRLIQDGQARTARRAAGIARAAVFSWDKAAEATMPAYRLAAQA